MTTKVTQGRSQKRRIAFPIGSLYLLLYVVGVVLYNMTLIGSEIAGGGIGSYQEIVLLALTNMGRDVHNWLCIALIVMLFIRKRHVGLAVPFLLLAGSGIGCIVLNIAVQMARFFGVGTEHASMLEWIGCLLNEVLGLSVAMLLAMVWVLMTAMLFVPDRLSWLRRMISIFGTVFLVFAGFPLLVGAIVLTGCGVGVGGDVLLRLLINFVPPLLMILYVGSMGMIKAWILDPYLDDGEAVPTADFVPVADPKQVSPPAPVAAEGPSASGPVVEEEPVFFVPVATEEPAASSPVVEAVSPTPAPMDAMAAADVLVRYKALLDQGIITEEEFVAKKKQLLGL